MQRIAAVLGVVGLLAFAVSCGDDASGDAMDGSDADAPDAPPGSTPDGAATDAAPGVGEPPELAGITRLHNQVRADVPTATPLPPLEWDAALAATAAAWVARCQNTDGAAAIMDHNPGRSDGHPYYVGENIYASSGTATAADAVMLWATEQANYDPATGACTGTCGHYTQVVWRTTRKVGCARGTCPAIQYPSTIVCNYGPGGNSGGPAY